MIRSILAIVVGFVLIGALSFGMDAVVRNFLPQEFSANGRVDNPAILLLTLGYVFIFAIMGCYLTGRLAPQNPMKHALILGVLGLIFNIIGTMSQWDTAPSWYHIVALLMVMPAAWLGGRQAEIKERQISKI